MTMVGRRMNREACEREALRCARMAAACERQAEAAAKDGNADADRLRQGARNWRARGVMYREAAEDGRA